MGLGENKRPSGLEFIKGQVGPKFPEKDRLDLKFQRRPSWAWIPGKGQYKPEFTENGPQFTEKVELGLTSLSRD